MRPDIRSLLHGIFNLILPFFAYDLAGLLVFSLTAGNYTPWASFWPMAVLIHLPFLSDVIGVVVGAVRYKRSKRVCAMLGIIFSIGGAVLYYSCATSGALPCLVCWSDIFDKEGAVCGLNSLRWAPLSMPTASAVRSR